MATTARSKKKTEDTRALNLQPNAMPATITVTVFSEGVEVGPVTVPQNGKLSDKGNVTFKGGIAGGWVLEGAPIPTLNSLSFVIDGVELTPSAARAHNSSNGNPTIFHGGTISLPVAGGAPLRHTVQVWTTYSAKYETYSLSVKAFPAPTGGGRPRGPQVVGQVGGGFHLVDRKVAVEAGA